MKLIFFIIVFLISNVLFSNCINKRSFRNNVQGDTSTTFLLRLEIGDTISYITFLTSCLSGDQLETKDSISFYRDSIHIKASYKNEVYIIKNTDLEKLRKLEHSLLSIGSTNKTSYYNYIVSFKGQKGLIGFGDKRPWDELINFLMIE